jgi:putative sigma-54 modulation protein
MEVTDAMKAYVEKKITKLSKYYNRISETEVIIDKEGLSYKIEVIIKADNSHPFIVHHSAEDMYACVDFAIDKCERQLTKHKEKSRNRKGRVSAAEVAAEIIDAENIEPSE